MSDTSADRFRFNGYESAQEIDDSLNELLENHSITKENLPEWRNLVRTIHTSLKLIGEKIEQVGEQKNYTDRLRDAAVGVLAKPKSGERTIETTVNAMRELMLVLREY